MSQQASQDGQGADGQSHEADGSLPEVSWVGEQRLMHGYCGRAITPRRWRPRRGSKRRAAGGRGSPGAAAKRQQPARAKVIRIGPTAAKRAAVANRAAA
jgi:hypothetical protein